MKNKLIIGRYLPYDSLLHRLDPRAKLVMTLLFVICALMANNIWTYALLILLIISEIFISRIPFKHFIRGIRPMLTLLLFTAILQVLFRPGHTVYFSLGWVTISKEGLLNGVFVFIRFSFIIVQSLLLTLTTEAIQLTDAMDYFLIPFKKVGLPVGELPLMLSIGIRFIPTLLDEAEIIMDAQRARGMDFSEGNFVEKLKKWTPILIPLFNRSYDRAFELAMAMDARNYQGDKERSKYFKLTMIYLDYLALMVSLLVFAFIWYLRD